MANMFTISESRQLIRVFSRNAGDPTVYATTMVDFSFQRAANELIRQAHLILRTDTTSTLTGTSSYATPVSTFRCDRMDSAFLSGPNVVVDSDFGYSGNGFSGWTRGAPMGLSTTRRTARLDIVDYTDLNDYLIADPNPGQPRMIAFQSDGLFSLYPIPDQVYTVNLRWSDFFTSWKRGIPLTSFTNTAGVLSAPVIVDPSDNYGTTLAGAFVDSGSGAGATLTVNMSNGSLYSMAVGGGGGTNYSAATILTLGGDNSADQTFNLPDDLMYEILSLGAPAFLQFNDPEKAFATAKGKEFMDFINRIKGMVGGLGVKRIIRRG